MLRKNKVLTALSLSFLMTLSGQAFSENNQWQTPQNAASQNSFSQPQYNTLNNNPYYSQDYYPPSYYPPPYYSSSYSTYNSSNYNPYNYPQQQNMYAPNQNSTQARGNGLQSWQSWFKNQFQNGSWQQGDGNVFQDAKGFYKLMGNGRTKWKFYFDVDFQAEMDAWMKGNEQTKNRQNNQWNGNTQQDVNGAGQPNWNQQGGYGNQYHPNSIYYYPNYPTYPSYAR